MVNLCEAIERLLLRHAKHMREAARQVSETLRLEAAPAGSLFHTGSVAQRAPRLRTWQRLSNERRAARLARYEEAVHHRAQGASIKGIARATVRNFVRSSSYPERAQRSRGPALSEAQRRYVGSRAAQGCYNATLLWQELRAEGFTGRRSVVHDALARACAATADGNRLRVVAAAAPTMGVPSTRRACAWLLDGKDTESDG